MMLGTIFKSLRAPAHGNWAGPIVIVSSQAAELQRWIAQTHVQDWMRCRSFATSSTALQSLPPNYGSSDENPCGISFIRYNASWIASSEDYRRVKMAVHEVLDLENSRRKTSVSGSLP